MQGSIPVQAWEVEQTSHRGQHWRRLFVSHHRAKIHLSAAKMLSCRHFNLCFNEFSPAMNRQFNKIMTHKRLLILLGNLLALTLCSERVLAQGSPSVITYQGSLRSAGVPANGHFDYVFTLFDAL